MHERARRRPRSIRASTCPTSLPLPDGERVRVVQLVATGTNGGAQEHVATLLARIDRTRYDVRVISLSDGSAVKRWRALGFCVEVVDADTMTRPRPPVADLLERWRTQVVHGHMYRAEIVGVLAADLLAGARPAPALPHRDHPFVAGPERTRTGSCWRA